MLQGWYCYLTSWYLWLTMPRECRIQRRFWGMARCSQGHLKFLDGPNFWRPHWSPQNLGVDFQFFSYHMIRGLPKNFFRPLHCIFHVNKPETTSTRRYSSDIFCCMYEYIVYLLHCISAGDSQPWKKGLSISYSLSRVKTATSFLGHRDWKS